MDRPGGGSRLVVGMRRDTLRSKEGRGAGGLRLARSWAGGLTTGEDGCESSLMRVASDGTREEREGRR